MQQAISMQEAVEMYPDGARVMRSGFMGMGTPDGLVRAPVDSGKRDLTMIVNDAARPHTGVGPLVSAGCVPRFIGSPMASTRWCRRRSCPNAPCRLPRSAAST
jgi:acetate CoA/acetoacetate CoA-transferase alpha subunit